ncbi:SRPBCC domain-containing protein [Tabrizicola caldifontis]|uniref:SRPBCC domain-containing protein n=1 Tax=Tabrizicola caldifontis TaxID=2528036 RepID=UPI00108120F3|nr:SRPBCC domain-containing protein [Rhodobacter sp. YIM 73028]
MTNAGQWHETFTIDRIYPNCLDHVWACWAVPDKKRAWFGDGLRQMDFRPGGVEAGGFQDAMGEHQNETRYFEISDRQRIVLAYSMALNGRVHTVSLATIAFAEHEGGTRLTYTEQMCVIPPSDGLEGRRHGWDALLTGLENYLSADTIGHA